MSDAYNPMTHCSHGNEYIRDCQKCDEVWARTVLLPDARKTVATLLKFYGKRDLVELIFAQNVHIEKLQAKLPPTQHEQLRKLREG